MKCVLPWWLGFMNPIMWSSLTWSQWWVEESSEMLQRMMLKMLVFSVEIRFLMTTLWRFIALILVLLRSWAGMNSSLEESVNWCFSLAFSFPFSFARTFSFAACSTASCSSRTSMTLSSRILSSFRILISWSAGWWCEDPCDWKWRWVCVCSWIEYIMEEATYPITVYDEALRSGKVSFSICLQYQATFPMNCTQLL